MASPGLVLLVLLLGIFWYRSGRVESPTQDIAKEGSSPVAAAESTSGEASVTQKQDLPDRGIPLEVDQAFARRGEPVPVRDFQRGPNQQRRFPKPELRDLPETAFSAEPVAMAFSPSDGRVELLEDEIDLHTRTARRMVYDVAALESVAAGKTARVLAPLPDGTALPVLIRSVRDRGDYSKTLDGEVEGDPQKSVVQFVLHDGIIHGSISRYDLDRHYEYRILGSGYLMVRELDGTSMTDDCGGSPDPIREDQEGGSGPAVGDPEVSPDTPGYNTIDVVVGYDMAARQADGGYSQIEARILGSVDRMNLAFTNSQTTQTELMLLGVIEDPSYVFPGGTSGDMGSVDELGNLENTGTGNPALNTVSDYATALGADLRSFVVRSADGSAGVAYRPGRSSITARDYMTSSRITFAHELGHNIGAQHSWGDTTTDSVTNVYRYGWRLSPSGQTPVRTIMAYDWDWGNGQRIPYYSNPAVTYQGARTGQANGYDATGDPHSDQRYVSGGLIGTAGNGFNGSNSGLGARNGVYLKEQALSRVNQANRTNFNVVDPAGGVTWNSGETREIYWTGGDHEDSVSIALYRNGTFQSTIASGIDGHQRRYDWTIPGGIAQGGGYFIRVTRNGTLSADSGVFSFGTSTLLTQTITFNAISDKITTDTVILSATGGGSGNPVTFAVTSGPASISGGNLLSFSGAGSVTITASQAGNGTYEPAPNVSRSFQVTKASATVTLGALSQTYNGSSRVATATTSPGGLSVSLTYDGSPTPPINAGSYAVVGTINNTIYQGAASGTLVVGKASASLSLSNLSQIYTGTARSVTVSTTPGGLSNSVTYNGSSFAPTNAGSYTIVATITDPNYQGSTSGTFNITKATATITLTNLSQTYSGGPRPVTVTTNPLGLSYTLTYNGIASAPFDAGTYNVAAAINHANYQGGNTAVLEIAKAGQIIDFPLPPASTLATATVNLEASGGGSGNPIVYSIVSGPGAVQGSQLTFTGSGTVRVSASQAGGTNHDPASVVERDFNVVKDTAEVSLSSMQHTYDGSQKQPVVTTTPEGLPVSITFNGNSNAPSSVGTYALVATVADPRYDGSATGTFEIEKAPASVTLSSLSQVYNGTPRSVSVTTNPPGLAVSLSYAGSPTPPTGAGSYPVTATIVENNYAGSGGETFVVAKATQVINFPPIAEQEATTTLPLTATGGGSGNPIVFSVTEGPANLNGNSLTFFGTGDVSVRADQSGDSNHEAAPPVFRTFSVTRERVEISITGLSQPYDGTPRPVSVTTNPAGLPVRVTYAGSLDPPTVPGSYFVLALVDEEFYEGDAGGTLLVSKGIQTIDFPQPGPALANATVTLSASGGDSENAVVFEVTGGPGEVSGNQLSFTGDGFVTVRATQPGNALYDDATPVDRIIGVTKAPAIVALTDLAQTFDGSSKVPTATTSPPGLSVSYQFDGGPDPAIHAGSYAVVATVSDPRYSGSASDSFVIARASQVIDFTQPAPALATDSVVLQATGGGSGNGVEFSIQSGPGSIAGNVLTFSAAGTVVILADQDGDPDHDPAATVSRTLVVSKAPPQSLTLTRMHQVFDGTARVAVPVTVPSGLNVELEYEGSSDPPIGTGSYQVVATINDPVYEGIITGNLIVDDPYRLELVPGGGLPAISTLGAPTVRSIAVAPYEVTWSVWLTVRDWANAHGYDLGSVGEGCAPDHPVRGVSWFDAVKWCNARTEWENETLSRQIEPAYRFEGNVFRSGTPSGTDEVVCNSETSGYRLPSGIEREFAARGGELGGGTFYPGSNDPLAVGWHASNAAGAPCDLSGGLGTHPAGDLLPNELGLYDLAGNVAEWTGDAAPGNAASRMANGGDWDDPASGLLHSTLGEAVPPTRDSHIGFRVARSLSEAIAAAVDRTDLTWETGGDQTWFASAGAPGTMSITAASPPPVESEEHWVEVEATGPGNLSFFWVLATPAGAADLTVEIDGLAVASAAENGGLVEESLYLTTGTHRVRWRHRGLSSAATQPGVHGAWLDQVVLTPAVIPDLNTMDVTGLGEEGALMNAELMDDGGSPVSAIGFTIVLPGGGEIDLVGDPGGLPDFAEPADSLTPGTTYRVRAYATNEVGTGYGEWVRFTTVEQVSVEENAAVRDREIESGDGHVFDLTLLSPRHLVVTSSGGAPITAQLLDGDGNIVAESTATGDFDFNELLLAGDYRLRIQRGSEPGTTATYQVSLDGTLLAESLPDVAVGPSSGLQTGRGLRSGRTGQNVILFSPKARPVQAFATVANMGTLPDEMRIFGSRGTADFVLSYFGTGGNITGGMLTGRAASSELVVGGDIEVIRVAVTPNKRRIVKKVKRRTVTLKKTLLVSVRATSTFDPANPDAGYLEVKTK